MSVEINPSSQLGFHRPLTTLVRRTLTVANHNGQPVAFKVKTTAPKQYCVRPNSGRIEPGEKVDVQVLLQPMKEDPEPGAKCRDKFLVQSVVISPERESRPLPELWSLIEKEDKSSIQEHKIRCTYLPPLEAGATAADESSSTPKPNGVAEQATAAVGGAAAAVGATGAAAALARDDDEKEASKFDTVRSQPTSAAPPQPPSYTDGPAAAAASLPEKSSAGPGSAIAAGTSSDETAKLKAQLADANKELAKLRAQLKEREAGIVSKPLPTGEGLQTQAIEVAKGEAGVPLQTVMILLGATFFLTWLFF